MNERRQILIEGTVQGVGFRPFVYGLARARGLGGFVLNNNTGVLIELEGDRGALDHFIADLKTRAPAQAFIERVVWDSIPSLGEKSFSIAHSRDGEARRALISPDRSICDDCLRELFDPLDRRYRFPFINCTNCGPRFTILAGTPYDREQTTMAAFSMCAECERECRDPANRRFHSQANSCARCGPKLRLIQADADGIGEGDAVIAAARLLVEGAILAVKGLGGYHLACNALDEKAVAALRSRKKREEKPFALMAKDLATIERFCLVDEEEKFLLTSARRPIVLLAQREPNLLPKAIAPGQRYLGWMLPYTPLHCLLTRDSGLPLVMTSGNLSAEPIAYKDDDALQRLSDIADYFLVHNREIQTRCEDSVVRLFNQREMIIRRSRGYAPQPLALAQRFAQPTLACGAHLKNTFCIGKERHAILSPHLGDLENYESLSAFTDGIELFKQLFDVQPMVVAHDHHPDYLSTKYAAALEGVIRIGVQHHHAHIASCMAEHGLQGPVIGVAFDGIGYGNDGTLWGGEFLTANLTSYNRRAHLRYVPLAGGEAAIRQPWRSALSYARDALGKNPFALGLPTWKSISPTKVALVEAMLDKNVNTFRTSSCGRLFDAVASILGLCHEASFEGQAAMAVEMSARAHVADDYPFEIHEGELWEVDLRLAFACLVQEVIGRCDAGVIAARFHNTIAAVIIELCCRLRKAEGLNQVCLSGGTFQNQYLLKHTVPCLQRCGFEVFLNSKVPCNDGGISLGQAVVANEIVRRGVGPCV